MMLTSFSSQCNTEQWSRESLVSSQNSTEPRHKAEQRPRDSLSGGNTGDLSSDAADDAGGQRVIEAERVSNRDGVLADL